MHFKTRWRSEADGWSESGSKISAPENLEAIRQELERGPIVVEHWHYRGSSAPSRQVFAEYDAFILYLEEHAYAGDAFDVWSWEDLCRPERRLVEGKCPAEDGKVPSGGAY
jgi:hypothetical protein